eukprot:gene10844-12631_t
MSLGKEMERIVVAVKNSPLTYSNHLGGKRVEGTDVATQYFNKIPEDAIEALIAQGDVMYCAGGFTVEHMSEYTLRLDGEIETVMGLPKTMTNRLIQESRSSS